MSTIQINNKTFKLKFGLKVFRLLGKAWGVSTLNDTLVKFGCLGTIGDNLTYEQLDVITDLIIASVQANEENTETITRDEIDDLFLKDTVALLAVCEVVMIGFTECLPKAEENNPGKSPAVKKTAKK